MLVPMVPLVFEKSPQICAVVLVELWCVQGQATCQDCVNMNERGAGSVLD
jgi:hypothetical protein